MSSITIASPTKTEWKVYQKIGLRFFFIYFVLLAVPLDYKFYLQLFSIDWFHLKFYDLFQLTRYTPQFFGIIGLGNWAIAALIALVGTVVWSYSRYKNLDYDKLHYWLRVILRYRLAIGIIGYGLIKLFPLQMPFPSLSNLHTNYGDFYGWKIYFHTQGIAQGYEAFLGAVEIVAGFLLFFRRTTTFGAGIILGFLGNVFAANLAYNIGEQVYSAYLVSLALFLFIYDVPRLYSLLALERFTKANRFQPVLSKPVLRQVRLALKTAFVLFVAVLSFTTYANYTSAPYKLPQTPGIRNSYGFYNVREFKLNNQVIPYSTTHPERWQNVIFEKWATISIKTAKPIRIDSSTGDEFHFKDVSRNFESAGLGGRRYFAYQPDTVNHLLVLQNKNQHHQNEKFRLKYQFLNDSTLVVRGVNEKQDSVYAVLDRIEKKYMLLEGRRKPVKL
ncbi:MAG: DoxX family protein [Bacteroidota bacterium]|nr:DoxX family protein [Bacteroidota bacterium]